MAANFVALAEADDSYVDLVHHLAFARHFAIVKTCGCCGRHISGPEWGALRVVTTPRHPTGICPLGERRAEWRNCSCGSTLTLYVEGE